MKLLISIEKGQLLMKKSFAIIMTTILLFASSINLINAKETSSDSDSSVLLSTFEENVKSSNYYSQFSSDIIEMNVARAAETQGGLRYTINFILKSSDTEARSLIFIGNQSGNILEALEITFSESGVSINDLLKKYIQNVNTPIKPRVKVTQCISESCAVWKTSIDIHSNLGCSYFIGQSCNSLKPYNFKGLPIAYLLCRGYVWVACNVSVNKYCVSYNETLYTCTL